VRIFSNYYNLLERLKNPPTNTKNMSSDQNCAAAIDAYPTEGEIQTTIKGVSPAVQKLILKLIEKEEKRIERLTRLGKCSVNPHRSSVADTCRAEAVRTIEICHGMTGKELKTESDSMNNKWSQKGLRYHLVKQLLLEATEKCAQNEVLTRMRENGIQLSGHKGVGMPSRSVYLIKEYLSC
jgi:hypothetical protein